MNVESQTESKYIQTKETKILSVKEDKMAGNKLE